MPRAEPRMRTKACSRFSRSARRCSIAASRIRQRNSANHLRVKPAQHRLTVMIVSVVKMLGAMLTAPVRRRRSPADTPPAGREHYEPTPFAASREAATLQAADIPVAKTPAHGWQGSDWPAPVLAGCDEPLVEGAPDLRGVWRVEKGPLKGHVERVEQAGDRVVITAAGIIHDMFVNGTLEGGGQRCQRGRHTDLGRSPVRGWSPQPLPRQQASHCGNALSRRRRDGVALGSLAQPSDTTRGTRQLSVG